MKALVAVGAYCPNETCIDYGKVEAGNIIRYGRSGEGQQRFRCKSCRKTFNERTGTLFHGRQTPADDRLEVLALLAEGMRISSITRAKGFKEDTILDWLRAAARHAEQVEPPRELVGERCPYYNHLYSSDTDRLVLVEGQADAITFGEWNIPALAIVGMHISDELLASLRSHRRVLVALDNTREAMERNREVARKLGTLALIPRLPDGVKDANDWLSGHGATAEDVNSMLNKAKTWLQLEIERTAFLDGLERQDAVRDLFRHAVKLDEMELTEFRAALAKLDVKGRAFNDLLKAARAEEAEKGDDMPQILGDDVPLLSPALEGI